MAAGISAKKATLQFAHRYRFHEHQQVCLAGCKAPAPLEGLLSRRPEPVYVDQEEAFGLKGYLGATLRQCGQMMQRRIGCLPLHFLSWLRPHSDPLRG
jgi:hypothetical protein